MDLTNTNNKEEGFYLENRATRSLFPFEFPYGFGASDLSSPVEFVMGSTETESDDEDYIAGLTRQIAHSTLEDDNAPFVSGLSQSTVCSVGRCTQGSSRGTPTGTWDLLYAAAGEIARMRMGEESYGYHQHNRGLLDPPRKPLPISVPVKNHHPNLFDADGSIYSHQKLQATQFQQLGSSVWGGSESKSKANGLYEVMRRKNTNKGRPLGLSHSAWPSLQHATTQEPQTKQQQKGSGSGVRGVFLRDPGPKRESAGTGVFLPRRINTPTEPRKSSVCSTPALDLNLDEKHDPFHPYFGNFMPESDAAALLRSRNSNGASYRKRILRPQQAMNHEIRLPQEWTY